MQNPVSFDTYRPATLLAGRAKTTGPGISGILHLAERAWQTPTAKMLWPYCLVSGNHRYWVALWPRPSRAFAPARVQVSFSDRCLSVNRLGDACVVSGTANPKSWRMTLSVAGEFRNGSADAVEAAALSSCLALASLDY